MEPADVEQERPMGRWTAGRGERGGVGLNWAEARPTRGKGRRGKGPTGEKEGVWAVGLLGCCSLLLFFFFSFSFLYSNIQTKLFEFN
jgi:hypothetical protein